SRARSASRRGLEIAGPVRHRRRLEMRAPSAALRKSSERRSYEATASAAALPAARPEKMQPPRNVPSRER
ncbi:hypothetical protein GA0115253_1068812, partial [Streptomyces sp. Termitarium-T10T-6]